MVNFKAQCVLEARAELGECPIWSLDEQRLYWIDIDGKSLNAFDPATGDNRVWPMPQTPGSYVLREGGGLTLALRDGFHDFDPATGALVKRMDAPYDQTRFRFNDGRTDRQGRYWVGSMFADYGEDRPASGATYCYDGATLTERIAPISHANGHAFSPDGRTMYRAETGFRTIYAYDLDPGTGAVSNERLFAKVPDSLGLPDGATIDSEGGYWAALPNGPDGGSVARFAPDGRLDLVVDVPVLLPLMPAFGGPDLATLYITSGRIEAFVGKDKVTPQSGGIFAVDTGYRGIAEVTFKPR